MKQYSVAITQETDEGSVLKAGPQMTVRIEVVDGQAHVVEMTMRAQAGADLTSGPFPSVDLECLARAFASEAASRAPVPVTAAQPTVSTPAAPQVPAPEVPAPEVPAPQAAAPQPAVSQPVVPEPQDKEAERPHRSKRTVSRPKTPVPGARAYRKMPDPDELQRVYGDVGSIAGVAKHYNVPAHTAQGWIGRLRKRGVVPS
ncbi:hypothetical protein AB0C18_32800 [Nonomuraea muscovyensis]|uniref:hypothetical protein n=1 Tax=Nonomuraea muscovyensis TaxID=1124761 RepID=UPI0033D39CB4